MRAINEPVFQRRLLSATDSILALHYAKQEDERTQNWEAFVHNAFQGSASKSRQAQSRVSGSKQIGTQSRPVSEPIAPMS